MIGLFVVLMGVATLLTGVLIGLVIGLGREMK